MGSVKISTDSLNGLIKNFGGLNKKIDAVAEASLNDVTKYTLAEAKKNTAKGVEKGNVTNLRDSWYVTKLEKKGKEYTRSVKNDARSVTGEYYAGYYEYGHRTRLGTSKNPKYKPKKGAKAWVKGRFPLLKATVKARERQREIININMEKYFKGGG